jgi:hypothetical protein
MTYSNTSTYFTAAKDLTSNTGGASADVVYTCPTGFVALIKFIHVSNGATNNKKYSIQWYESSTATYHFLVDDHSLSANSLEDVVAGGSCIALQAGDKIVAHEESGGDFHIVVSGEEYFNPGV